MSECIFCRIAQNQAPATIEFETAHVLAFKSIQPVAEVHILITPKKHVANFLDLSTEGELVKEMAEVATRVISVNNIKSGYKLVFNGGKYQAIQHVHWHVLGGKFEEDGGALNKT